LSAQYAKLGDLTKLVHPAVRLSGSPTNRQTLTIGTGSLVAVKEKMAVVHPGGFVGQIYDISPGNIARVLLITDPESRLNGHFVRYVRNDAGGLGVQRVNTKPPLFEGNGNGLIVRMPAGEVRNNVRVGDVAVLDDATFSPVTKGLRLGTVRKIDLPATDAGFAGIDIDPTTDLAKLPEVLVVDRVR
jgi:cell shape-determining protein MreC